MLTLKRKQRNRATSPSGRLGTACTAILTIIDEESRQVRQVFGTEANVEGTPYYTDDLTAPKFFYTQAADRSNIPATLAAQAIIEDLRPEVLIVTGIAGGILGEVELGDVVVASYLHYTDFRKLVDGKDENRYSAYDQPSIGLRSNYADAARWSGQWRQRITAPRPDGSTDEDVPAVHVGSIIVGEKVLGSPDHPEQVRALQDHPDAIAVEMESIGVARTVHVMRNSVEYNPRLLVIRGISDFVTAPGQTAEENNEQRKLWKAYAADAAASFACDVAHRITRRSTYPIGLVKS